MRSIHGDLFHSKCGLLFRMMSNLWKHSSLWKHLHFLMLIIFQFMNNKNRNTCFSISSKFAYLHNIILSLSAKNREQKRNIEKRKIFSLIISFIIVIALWRLRLLFPFSITLLLILTNYYKTMLSFHLTLKFQRCSRE